jgi:C1A family cysteine protease
MATSHPSENRSFSVRPDTHDERDRVFDASSHGKHKYPLAVDLRDGMPPVYDQETLNSCSANAIAGAIWFDERKKGLHTSSPSRLFIYYNERDKEGIIDENAPVSLRDGYQSVVRQGVCREPRWPYDVRRYKHRPTDECYSEAEQHRVIRYLRVRRELTDFRACLNAELPFTAAVAVYESFKSHEVAKSGIVPMPAKHEKLLGGHALVVVGYDDQAKQLIARNSWGETWGDGGYCRMPFSYFENSDLAWDFWTVEKETHD